MSEKKISEGVVHKVPEDLKKVILNSKEILEKWESLTPLARNEWICWVTSVKKKETREEHIRRMCEDLLNKKRRPCCWPGCSHRKKKNPQQKI